MTLTATARMSIKTRGFLFTAVFLASILANLAFFKQLVEFSIHNEFSSHIFFIPLLSLALIFRKRATIFKDVSHSVLLGGTISVIAVALLISESLVKNGLDASDALSARALTIVILWAGMFLFFYGTESFRKALFSMLFLVLMVPIPRTLLEVIISALQRGSADMTALLFKITGTPYYRDGLTFVLPRISIEIATQCSSIRSSLALLISCLLAGHLILKTFWRKSFFALVAVPMAMIKNAIRIVTLSLLSIHIDRRFIVSSDLHHEGGIVFFLTTLLLLWPVLWLLRRSERETGLPKRTDVKAA